MAAISDDFIEFAKLVIDALVAADVDYMIGGSVAVWPWGEARTTRDFDLAISLPFEKIVPLSQELEKRAMLVPYEIIMELLIANEGDLPISAIHMESGYKAELFLLRPGDIFREVALSRRRLVDVSPELSNVYVHSPKDLIIYKLRYFQISEQTKHMRDIASIIATSGAKLDFDYIEGWVDYFGLGSEWQMANNWK